MRAEIEELVAMTLPHGPAFNSPGVATRPDRLRAADIAAALSGVHERGPYLLFLFTYLTDDHVHHELVELLTKEFKADRGLPENLRESPEALRRLVWLALEEKRNPMRCHACNGSGVDVNVVEGRFEDCGTCAGNGRLRKTQAQYRAKAYGCSDRWWRKQWRDVYELLLCILARWDQLAHWQILARFGR